MSRLLCLAAVVFCLQAVASDETDRFLMIVAKGVDADADGVITASELQKNMLLRYDTNHDGIVSQTEFLAQWDRSFDDQRSAGANVFRQVDSNSDESWTMTDFTVLSKAIDQNKDGSATVLEFVATVAGAFKAAGFTMPDYLLVG